MNFKYKLVLTDDTIPMFIFQSGVEYFDEFF
jgi:hypothetical protein